MLQSGKKQSTGIVFGNLESEREPDAGFYTVAERQ